MKKVEVMDTTLRDGEQMLGVSYSVQQKLTIAQMLLEEVKVDRIEITSAKSSEGEKEAASIISRWADTFNYINNVEILGFVDKKSSVDWVLSVGAKVINLLTKGSLLHCREQLKKTPKEHQNDIYETINYGVKNGIIFNVYLEDFSNGVVNSKDYLYDMIDFLSTLPIKRVMLPDTLGNLDPFSTFDLIKPIVEKYSNIHFDFHSHNDYGLGVANNLASVKAGVKGVHLTVNGLGERAGNAALDEVVVGLKDIVGVETNVDETKLYKVSKLVETFSGQRMCFNKPISGGNVFVQTAGVHADGDKKGDLYTTKLTPQRFAREREYALGKLSGKANLELNLKKLGISLDPSKQKILLEKIVELADKKKNITEGDLPFLINDIFEEEESSKDHFKIDNYTITTTCGLKPFAAIMCKYDGKSYESYSHGDGGYDAFMNALEPILKEIDVDIPKLTDYIVTIPPGGETDALVKTTIFWEISNGEKTISTSGLNCDQIVAAIEATIKIINYKINLKNIT